MRALGLVVVILTSACAQIVGIDKTTGAPPEDAGLVDAAPDAIPVDAPRACAGGDARVVDPATGGCFVLFTTPLTRDEARATCDTLGPLTRLAQIDDADENALVTTLIGAATVFIGARDTAVEGTFVWDDGAPLTYTNWNPGEPNNAGGVAEEDCATMLGALAGVWDDRPCAGPVDAGAYAFVCEHGG